MFRTIIFWLHLCSGVCVGLVVLMMSVTGVLISYERQILAYADRAYFQSPPADIERLPIDDLIKAPNIGFSPSSITLNTDPLAPAILSQGRRNSSYVNPYTGEIYPRRSESLDHFFDTVTALHRWFNLSGERRALGRSVTGISNLVFLFIVLSGMYLWLPKLYRWSAFKLRVLFVKAPNSAARDFNWHHVFGIWAALPLIVIVPTAAVFNYSWANNLVYYLAGEEPPQRGRSASSNSDQSDTPAIEIDHLPLETLFQQASRYTAQQVGEWNRLTLTLPDSTDTTVSFSIDQGNGGQPQKRHSFTLDAQTGEVTNWAPFSSLNTGRKARSWIRFLHTGEALGIAGQTVAGLASLAGAFLVYTGLALAIRRFIRFRKRRKNVAHPSASETA